MDILKVPKSPRTFSRIMFVKPRFRWFQDWVAPLTWQIGSGQALLRELKAHIVPLVHALRIFLLTKIADIQKGWLIYRDEMLAASLYL